MAAKWTKAQSDAINVRDKKVLVAAGAGSGKTAVLVERVISRIIDEKEPVDVDELLIMTFTRAAASEMRERIFKRIEEAMAACPYGSKLYERLKRQSALVEHARIVTIDSFCLSIIREHIDRVPLDSAFRIADQGELSLIKDEVLSELMEEKYAANDENYIRLVDSFSGAKSDSRIKEYIEGLYSFASAKPWPEKWLNELLMSYEEGADRRLWEAYITDKIKYAAGDIEKKILLAIDLCNEESGPYAYKNTFEAELLLIRRLAAALSYTEVKQALQAFDFPMIGRASKDTDAELKARAKGIRDDYKKIIKDNFIKSFIAEDERIELEESAQAAMIKALINLCLEYMERLLACKVEKNIADFNDIEHFALEILWNKGEKSTAALEYALQFKEIYIDEYQDSNYVQEELINAIENGNVFMVGDVKQSIYAFRQAKPELFNYKYNTYTKYNTEINSIESKEVLINLKQNFRSRSSVLEGINALFYKIMSAGLGGIEYDSEAALYPGALYEEINDERGATSPVPQLILYEVETKENEAMEEDSDLSKVELEAKMIALKIKAMISGETQKPLLIKDAKSGAYRQAKYSDIVILFRAVSGRAEAFVDTLIAEGIPAYAETSAGYFDALEVRVILALLQAVDNPYSEVELAAFLHSPIIGLSDNELAAIICLYRKYIYEKISGLSEIDSPDKAVMLYDACLYVINEEPKAVSPDTVSKLKNALAMLDKYRAMSKYIKFSELLRHIYEETGYLDYAAALPAGEIRKANLVMLAEKAAAYEATGFRGLFNFIRYIDNLKQYSTDYGEASILGEFDNTVRIMSIHKSKGLEFPICFIANIGKRFNFQDMRSSIVIDSDLGLACDYVDFEKRIKWSSIKKNVLKYKMKQQALAEEIRILYVAMSRAKEALIMTASVKDYEEALSKYNHLVSTENKALSATDTASANSFLDWLLMSLPYIKNQIRVTGIGYSTAADDELLKNKSEEANQKQLETELEKLTGEPAVKENNIKRLIDKPYEFAEDIELCTKLSIAKINRLNINTAKIEITGLSDEEAGLLVADEDYLQEADSAAGFIQRAVDRGNAFHRIMELLDYEQVHDENSLEAFIEGLIDSGIISEHEKKNINKKEVINFINSELGALFKAAYKSKKLKREKSFIMTLPARQLNAADSDEPVLIQGIIDAYIEKEDYIILVDYKTDRKKSEQELIEKYSLQLSYYTEALEAALQKRVAKKYIWSCRLNKALEL